MTKEEAKNLYQKFLDENCTPGERAIVESWSNEFMNSDDNTPSKSEFLHAKIHIRKRLESSGILLPQDGKPKSSWAYKITVAASIVVTILGIGTYFLVKSPLPSGFANDINPGGNKAILILANGKEIILNDAKNGEIADQKGVKITKSKEGQLVYDASAVALAPLTPALENKISPTTSANSGAPASPQDTGELNTVKTPRGGQYEIILPDGTKVWLNAASTLKFPSTFMNLGERRVELIGEAYFEVAKVKTLMGKLRKHIPFIVKTPQQEVKVLGTHFNINCYKDEPDTRTTLVEGSVSVSIPELWYSTPGSLNGRPVGFPERGFQKTLEPGEQAINTGSSINVINADIQQAIAWKNGDFMFRNESLESIMRKIARWYDVEVVYENKVDANKPFGGTISRFGKVSDVLCMLELTGQVTFKVQGNKITVAK